MLRGTKTLLAGTPGSGKTTALVTFLKSQAIKKLCVVGTEPGFEESLLDAMKMHGLPMDRLHYKYVSPSTGSFGSLRDTARKLNTLGHHDISELKSGIDKGAHQQFFNLLDVLGDFTCERTGESLGPVDEFPEDWAFGLDGLTGINRMVYGLHLGSKPTPHKGEWNIIMNFEENFLTTLTSELKCFAAVTCHVIKSVDELTGYPNWTINALGSKLGPRIPYMFSDTPLAFKEGNQFFWATTHSSIDLKNRALPIKDKLPPDFSQIVQVWEERQKASSGE